MAQKKKRPQLALPFGSGLVRVSGYCVKPHTRRKPKKKKKR